MKYVAACSFGKDSIATVILAKEHNEPLDEVIYCEVMFDDQISGEVPEHRDFIYEIAKPMFESWGIKVTILRSQKTYVSNFMHVITKGKQAGKIRAFPLCGRCTIQRDCKLPPMEKYKKTAWRGRCSIFGNSEGRTRAPFKVRWQAKDFAIRQIRS